MPELRHGRPVHGPSVISYPSAPDGPCRPNATSPWCPNGRRPNGRRHFSRASRSTGIGRASMADARTARNLRSSTWKPSHGFARDTQQRRVCPNSSLNPSAAFRARTAHSLFHQGFLMEQLNGHAIIDWQHFCGGTYRAQDAQCPTATLGQRAASGCA